MRECNISEKHKSMPIISIHLRDLFVYSRKAKSTLTNELKTLMIKTLYIIMIQVEFITLI